MAGTDGLEDRAGCVGSQHNVEVAARGRRLSWLVEVAVAEQDIEPAVEVAVEERSRC